jgi:hypothetical protein
MLSDAVHKAALTIDPAISELKLNPAPGFRPSIQSSRQPRYLNRSNSHLRRTQPLEEETETRWSTRDPRQRKYRFEERNTGP